VGVSTLIGALNDSYGPAAVVFTEGSWEFCRLTHPPATGLAFPLVLVCRHTPNAVEYATRLVAGANRPELTALAVSCTTPERVTYASGLALRCVRDVVPVVVLPWVSRMETKGPSRSYVSAADRLRDLMATATD